MGGPLAAHLAARSGARVIGYDTAKSAREEARAHGVEPADSLAAIARAADIVFLSLPGAAEVEAACTGEGTLLAASPDRERIIVDMSTTPVEAVRRLGAVAASAGVAFADAPVAGTADSVRERRVSVMVGADPTVFGRIAPLLAHMAEEVLHCGPMGAGAATKLLVNAVIAQTGVALAETLTLARRAGVDDAALFEAYRRGCDGFVLRQHGFGALLPGEFPRGRFPARYMLKDLRYALELAAEHRVPLEGTAVAARWLDESVDAGDGDAYWPVLVRRIES
jgi:hypothetical protein